MNERDELAYLKAQQKRLEQELGLIDVRLSRLERRLNSFQMEQPQGQQQSVVADQLATAPAAPSEVPPVIAAVPGRTTDTPPLLESALTQPEPPATETAARTRAEDKFTSVEFQEAETRPEIRPQAAEKSLELRLGTYWAPRVGIVVLLTGLVFIGNLAYQRLGALGKVLLLYTASGVLLGAGTWWHCTAKETLKNYAQVLFAGGLAALYFTTYGAHHLESLRVIQSTLLDGLLLLGCAGFMVWTADRWRSEILAIFGVGLAYYTCVMTRVGYFTLYSNLLLAVTAVIFLVRNRWVALSFGSLLATYAAYGFWRFFNGSIWHWASPSEGLWSGTCFLFSYWAVFTAGVFLSREEKFAGENRAAFLTLNNGAMFAMFVLTMLQVSTGDFWKFCLAYGAVLLALAEAAKRLLANEPPAKNFYVTQGLLLVTIGFISKFCGLQLALILAAESVVVLLMAYQRKSMVLHVAAYTVAALGVGWGIDGLRQFEPADWYLGCGLGALMLVNALIVHRGSPLQGTAVLRPQVGYFVVLALTAWCVTTWTQATREHFPLVLAAEGLLLTFCIYLLRVREIPLLSQSYLVVAQVAWVLIWLEEKQHVPWWNPLLLIGITLFLSHWWQKQKVLPLASNALRSWQGLYGLAIVGVLYFWLGQTVSAPHFLALTGLLAVGLTAYAVVTRVWLLGACAQLFNLAGVIEFASQLSEGHPSWQWALAPIASLVVLCWGTERWYQSRPTADPRVRDPLLKLALFYRWAALVMLIAWVWEYIPAKERIWVFTGLGLMAFVFAGWKRNREALLFMAVLTAVALGLFWWPLPERVAVYRANLAAILVLLGEQQAAKLLPERYQLDGRLHGAVIFIGGVSVWLFCTRWVMEAAGGFYLTASWSLLALAFFTCGIVVRERVYRWLGLGLLACALGRIVIFDVWKLETLYRILSFMALGIVLLVLGFVYSKYQEKIKEWL